MTFREWISRHYGKDTPLGHLAYDIAHDELFPYANHRAVILYHLNSFTVCTYPDSRETFERAWKAYQAYERRHSKKSE